MTHRVAYNIRLHASETYRMLVDTVSENGDNLPTLAFRPASDLLLPPLVVDQDAIARVRKMLSQRFDNASPGRIVLLNANAGDLLPIRRWADERYVELAQRLMEKYPDVCIALTGAKVSDVVRKPSPTGLGQSDASVLPDLRAFPSFSRYTVFLK